MDDLIFSLIIPTLNRKLEVDALLNSILHSKYNLNLVEVIIVDQNEGNILEDIITKYKSRLNIIHLKVNFKGAARARNYGLNYASGNYIHFPDDDSFYSENTLNEVESAFKKNRNIDAISVKVLDPISNRPALLNFPTTSCFANCRNFYKLTIEFNTFWRKNSLVKLGGFDENLGLGTSFPSEESGDLILRALRENYRILYYPNIVIFHPDKRESPPSKIYNYAIGFGALLRKHVKLKNFCILPYAFSYIGKSIIGIIIYTVTMNNKRYQKYKNRLLGVIDGYRKSKGLY